MDAFDRFWQCANKPLDSHETNPAELHHAATSLPMEDWYDREKVNAAARRAGVAWHDPEGVAFECPMLTQKTAKPCRATS